MHHSNVPGLWEVYFFFMKWVKPTCGRGWWTSTLGWAWALPDRCRLRQKNFRKEFPWRLRIWILIPLNHQCLNTLESANIMPWGTHSLIYFYFIKKIYWGIGDPPANSGDTRDPGSIPGSERSPGEENGNPLQYSCLGIPWTEEPDRLQSVGSQTVVYDWSNLAVA